MSLSPKQHLAESLVCSEYTFKESVCKSYLKGRRMGSEAICTWTSPPTPPTMGSSSKTFTISTEEAGSSMVSESQTCKEESRNELKKRKKYECGHYCQNWAHRLGLQLDCHRASISKYCRDDSLFCHDHYKQHAQY